MLNVLHVYDNESVMLAFQGIVPDDDMVYHPYDIFAFSPEILECGLCNLIIFDVFREEKSYLILFSKIRKWIEVSGATRPPIIVITEDGSDLTEQSARMEGADFFFIKPFNMEELVVVLKQISSPHFS